MTVELIQYLSSRLQQFHQQLVVEQDSQPVVEPPAKIIQQPQTTSSILRPAQLVFQSPVPASNAVTSPQPPKIKPPSSKPKSANSTTAKFVFLLSMTITCNSFRVLERYARNKSI